jgi:3-methyladenine DNA glycosylase/8-oxoguanine DNA glycosylase
MSEAPATTLGSRTSGETIAGMARSRVTPDCTAPYEVVTDCTSMATRTLQLTHPLDLGLTLGLLRRGLGDPTIQLGPAGVVRASRTPDGAGTIAIRQRGAELVAESWGPGGSRLLDDLPALVGADDDPGEFRPAHPLVRDLRRRMPGLRLGRTGNVIEALVPAILEQKVTGTEAFGAWRRLVRRYGEPAPGPYPLWVPPPAATVAALPYHAFHPLGVEQRRADTIRRVTARADRLDALVDRPVADAYRALTSFAGVGPWTAAEVAIRALGDPDAVSVGDFHLPSLVAWALAGEPRADDARMLELLEPFRGQRGRVIRLLEASGIRPPRYGPRMEPRSIAGI